jgi:hypothetical protein
MCKTTTEKQLGDTQTGDEWEGQRESKRQNDFVAAKSFFLCVLILISLSLSLSLSAATPAASALFRLSLWLLMAHSHTSPVTAHTRRGPSDIFGKLEKRRSYSHETLVCAKVGFEVDDRSSGTSTLECALPGAVIM